MAVAIFYSTIFLIFLTFSLLYILNFSNILRNTILKKEAPYIPIAKSVLERVAKEMLITEKSLVYDLGCGDGRALFFLAKKYPQGHYVGVEKYNLPYMLAKINLFFSWQPGERRNN